MIKFKADDIDRSLISAMIKDPQATNVALAQVTGLSRNTVHSRIKRYEEHGIFRSVERRIHPAFVGRPLEAFIFSTVDQRYLTAISADLEKIPEVIQAHGLAGVTDILVYVIAKDVVDLYRIAEAILAIDGVQRTTTEIVMGEFVKYRVHQLFEAEIE